MSQIDTSKMSDDRFATADKFIGPTVEWAAMGSTGRLAAELRDEVRRLRERERVLVGHLERVLAELWHPGMMCDLCLCVGRTTESHNSKCPYRQAKEALGE